MERDNRNFYAFASICFGFITYSTYFKLPSVCCNVIVHYYAYDIDKQ